jgi:hypothetical protein
MVIPGCPLTSTPSRVIVIAIRAKLLCRALKDKPDFYNMEQVISDKLHQTIRVCQPGKLKK